MVSTPAKNKPRSIRLIITRWKQWLRYLKPPKSLLVWDMLWIWWFQIWQCVKTVYPCSSHQNSWDLWMFIPLKMVLIGIDPYPYTRTVWLGLNHPENSPFNSHWTTIAVKYLRTISLFLWNSKKNLNPRNQIVVSSTGSPRIPASSANARHLLQPRRTGEI